MLREITERLVESSIDFAQPTMALSKDVWDQDELGQYKLKDEVKQKIFDYIKKIPEVALMEKIVEAHLIGSLATNLYSEDSDIDVHVILDKKISHEDQEEIKEKVKHWVHAEANREYVGTHPIEVYVQMLPAQEYVGDSLYDLFADEWLKGPKFEKDVYNPYLVYKDVMDKVDSLAKEADVTFGEIKRDAFDHEVMLKAMQSLPPEAQVKLKSYLDDKLKEIEDNIGELLKDKEEWVKLRKGASSPRSKEQALKDVNLAKKWQESNAIFKFLDRYSYIRTITDLEKLLDAGLKNSDVTKVKDIIGVNNK